MWLGCVNGANCACCRAIIRDCSGDGGEKSIVVVVAAGSEDVSAVAVEREMVGSDGEADIKRDCSWAARRAFEAVSCGFGDDDAKN